MRRAFAAVLALIASCSLAAQTIRWQAPYRGCNAPGESTDQDLLDLAATGANMVRLGFPNHPLMNFSAPYTPNEAALQKLDRLLDVCERARLRVIIDPHTAPGFTSRWAPFTTMPEDPFWDASLPYQDAFVAFWGEVARRYKDRGEVVAGYDLMNEPNLFDQPGSGGKWNKLVRRMIQAIRTWDKRHTIIIEPPIVNLPGRTIQAEEMDTLNREGFLEAWPDANVVYSPHFYIPWRFTAQGLDVPVPNPTPKPKFRYPGRIDGIWYDRAKLESLLEEVATFQHRHRALVYIGEFSTTRWLAADGNRWLADAIGIFEHYDWSWTYHAWREWQGWDAEMSANPRDLGRHASTPRLKLLKAAFVRNAAAAPPRNP
jgi:endoglucanase